VGIGTNIVLIVRATKIVRWSANVARCIGYGPEGSWECANKECEGVGWCEIIKRRETAKCAKISNEVGRKLE
jgi:hypothetical protein